MEPDNSIGTQQPIEYRRLPDERFFASYANNVLFQPTGWDLTLVFGRTEPSKGPNVVLQDMQVTIPWSQAKVLVYFLQVQLIYQEMLNGRVLSPKGVINPPSRPTEEITKSLPEGIAQRHTKP
jgi:hypothetical protein